jgi:hypothetical protein
MACCLALFFAACSTIESAQQPEAATDSQAAAAGDAAGNGQGWMDTFVDRLTDIPGEIRVRFDRYKGSQNGDDKKNVIAAEFKVELVGDLTDDVQYNVIPILRADNAYDTSGVVDALPEDEPDRYHLNFDEAFLQYAGDSFDLKLGKQIYAWGVADSYNPIDNINPRDFINIADDFKIGVPSISLVSDFDLVSLEAVYIPIFTPSRLPGDDNRWGGDLSEPQAALPGLTATRGDRELPGLDLDRGQLAGRLSSSELVQGWDLGLSYYWGVDSIGVFRADTLPSSPPSIVLTQVYPEFQELGASVSTVVGDVELHGEAALHFTGDQDMDDDYLEFVLGLNYVWYDQPFEFLEEIRIALEYADEVITQNQRSNNRFVPTGEYVRPFRDSTMIGKVTFKISEDDQIELGGIANLSDPDGVGEAALIHKFDDGLTFKIGVIKFYGDDDGFFGRWSENSSIHTTFTKRF